MGKEGYYYHFLKVAVAHDKRSMLFVSLQHVEDAAKMMGESHSLIPEWFDYHASPPPLFLD